MVPFLLYKKDLKKLLAYSSLAHVGLIAGTYTLTIDGLRGAVLQMIAHGFVVVGLFFISDIILDDMKHELSC
jgi:NADH-quinone oxidoreductase subunit M